MSGNLANGIVDGGSFVGSEPDVDSIGQTTFTLSKREIVDNGVGIEFKCVCPPFHVGLACFGIEIVILSFDV